MAEVRVMVELRYEASVAAQAFDGQVLGFDATSVPGLPGIQFDPTFAPVPMPAEVDTPNAINMFDLETEPENSTYVVRAVVEESRIDEVRKAPNVVEVFSDPEIAPQIVCPGAGPVGTDADVERLLCVPKMRLAKMTGQGVNVAIVDTGVNIAYLNAHGKNPSFDAANSWVPRPGLVPGSLPVSHGTMCAYDVCIAAPNCTLLDIAVLQSTASGPTIMSGVLSDALRAYRHLLAFMLAPRRPGDSRSLVVNNSWGMFHPSWDLPVGDPGNYSDNPNHPFNRIVGDLERAGADILFAAGNCGRDCPDGRCRGITTNAIYGANGHPAVLCVAGVDTTKARVGYSTIGPGRLTRQKPDICGFTHFRGSGVYAADGDVRRLSGRRRRRRRRSVTSSLQRRDTVDPSCSDPQPHRHHSRRLRRRRIRLRNWVRRRWWMQARRTISRADDLRPVSAHLPGSIRHLQTLPMAMQERPTVATPRDRAATPH